MSVSRRSEVCWDDQTVMLRAIDLVVTGKIGSGVCETGETKATWVWGQGKGLMKLWDWLLGGQGSITRLE